jgi:Zn-dependent protease with chaperone function
MEPDEILFVMGHEMGHYALGHVWKGILFTWLLSLLVFGVTALVAGRALRRFGEQWGFTRLDDVASIPLLAVTMMLVLFVTQPLVNGFSRGLEREADVYGLEITRDNEAAARAFLKLGAQNKSDPDPPAWVRFVLYSHPTQAERVRLATTYRPWEKGEPNRLFRGK